jgi:hypothetical protein
LELELKENYIFYKRWGQKQYKIAVNNNYAMDSLFYSRIFPKECVCRCTDVETKCMVQ